MDNPERQDKLKALLKNGWDAPPPAEFVNELDARLRARLAAPTGTPRESAPMPRAPYRLSRVTRALRSTRAPRLLAVAAAVVLLVCLWPAGRHGSNGPGRVYGMTDAIAMFRNARVLHVNGWARWPFNPLPGEEQIVVPIEVWLDLVNGLARDNFPRSSENESKLDATENVWDHEFKLTLDHQHKTARFQKITPYQRLLICHTSFNTSYSRMFEDMQRRGLFKETGREIIGGQTYVKWVGVRPEDETTRAFRVGFWLNSDTGDISRLSIWCRRDETQAWPETPSIQYNVIQRLDAAPPGVFTTTPPAGYTLLNQKESAPLRKPSFDSEMHQGNLSYEGHLFFQLPDGSLIFCWSSTDARSIARHADFFKDLTPGGPLPRLPIEIVGFRQQADDATFNYTGYHLTCARKGDLFTEWGLYVPDHQRPVESPSSTMSCRRLHRLNDIAPEDGAADEAMRRSDIFSSPIAVDAGSFDALILGGIAEFSDPGAPLPDLNYHKVMELIRRIRESPPAASAPAASPPATNEPAAVNPPSKEAKSS